MGLQAHRPGYRPRGGKYSDLWQLEHLNNPRALVPASIIAELIPAGQDTLSAKHIADDMKVLRVEGVPYTTR